LSVRRAPQRWRWQQPGVDELTRRRDHSRARAGDRRRAWDAVEGRASRRVTSEAGRAAPVQAENRSTSPSQGGRSSSSPRGGDARLPVEPARYLREAQHQQHAPARRSGCSRTTSGCTLLASATTCRATGDAAPAAHLYAFRVRDRRHPRPAAHPPEERGRLPHHVLHELRGLGDVLALLALLTLGHGPRLHRTPGTAHRPR
jgi:hypothetical protein